MQVEIAVFADEVTLCGIGFDLFDLSRIAFFERCDPARVQFACRDAQGCPNCAAKIRTPPDFHLPIQFGEFVAPKGVGNKEGERITVVVHFFKSETCFGAKDGHFGTGEQAPIARGLAQDHIAVRVPLIVLCARRHVLRRAFGKPRRDDGCGNGVSGQDIGIAGEDVVAFAFALILQVVDKDGGDTPRGFAGDLERDNVRQFVRYHVWEPICTTAQCKVEVGDPDFDGVVVIIRRAIGIVFGVFEDDANFAIGFKIVKGRDRAVRIFRDLCSTRCQFSQTLMVIDFEVFGFNDAPVQFGMIGVKLREGLRAQGQEDENYLCEFVRHSVCGLLNHRGFDKSHLCARAVAGLQATDIEAAGVIGHIPRDFVVGIGHGIVV